MDGATTIGDGFLVLNTEGDGDGFLVLNTDFSNVYKRLICIIKRFTVRKIY